jgi:hypothetical protein
MSVGLIICYFGLGVDITMQTTSPKHLPLKTYYKRFVLSDGRIGWELITVSRNPWCANALRDTACHRSIAFHLAIVCSYASSDVTGPR